MPEPVKVDEAEGARPRSRLRRWLLWLGVAAVVLLAAAFAAGEYVVHHAEPILRARVIQYLEDRFHSQVELDELHLSLAHGFEASGRGLRIMNLRPDERTLNGRPMLSVKNFEFRAGIRQLFEPTMRIGTVYVQGLELNIPPKQMRGPVLPRQKNGRHVRIAIDRVECSDAVIRVETLKPGKLPLEFDIHDLVLTEIAPGRPMRFDARLENPKPVGEIRSTGHFGPWNGDEPRDSPVSGTYSFRDADLGTIKGIGGILSSTGEYSGVLGQIAVNGTTDTPDFHLDVSEHPMPLHTDFQAEVDGTTGDTVLRQVKATLGRSVLYASGAVLRASDAVTQTGSPPQAHGHDIELTVTTDQARIEELLRLAVKTSPPLMSSGALRLKTKLSIPPGTESVSRRMKLAGTFRITGVTLSNQGWQTRIDTLSERAQGHPKQANADDAARVTSAMDGRFAIAGGVVHIPQLNYRVPGAEVRLAGDYGMDGQTFEFAGVVRTDAKASEMLTGWKSLLAKPFDRMFEKHGAGLEVPVKVSGTKSEPKFGVDLDKMGLGFLSGHKDKDGNAKP